MLLLLIQLLNKKTGSVQDIGGAGILQVWSLRKFNSFDIYISSRSPDPEKYRKSSSTFQIFKESSNISLENALILNTDCQLSIEANNAKPPGNWRASFKSELSYRDNRCAL